jgi:Nif-specific regulatory protein
MYAELIGASGPVFGRTVPLDGGDTTIGRAADNNVCIPDRSVSRAHCIIHRRDEGCEIEDLDSFNGTFVNGLRVRTRALSDGDTVAVGDIGFTFRAAAAGSERVSITPDEVESSQLLTVCAPGAPFARETAALLRVSEAVRVFQALYLEHQHDRRRQLERRFFEAIFELIPSRRGIVILKSGETPQPFASFTVEGEPSTQSIAESIFHDAVRQGGVVTGRTPESQWIATTLMISDRPTGALYLDAGGWPREYVEGDAQVITALCGLLALALENARDIEALRSENAQLRTGDSASTPMIGNSAVMKGLCEAIAKVSRTSSTALLRGESGTGKELVARAIHRNSPRASRPFVVVNCAAIAEALLESEFFGHEKGAFTGAYAQRKGRFEQADGGTIFLDEVGELAMTLQAKLLRVLQEHEFERVGGSRTIAVDVRVIAATNRDLEQSIKAGRFREDLFYRLNVVPLRAPPLRERREDIPLLANWFVRKFAEQCGRAVTGVSREARAFLLAYDWPGNVRELQNVIERAVVMGSSSVITPEDLADSLPDTMPPAECDQQGFHESVREARRRVVATAIERANGNVPAAARALRLHPKYLHRLITALGLRGAVRE